MAAGGQASVDVITGEERVTVQPIILQRCIWQLTPAACSAPTSINAACTARIAPPDSCCSYKTQHILRNDRNNWELGRIVVLMLRMNLQTLHSHKKRNCDLWMWRWDFSNNSASSYNVPLFYATGHFFGGVFFGKPPLWALTGIWVLCTSSFLPAARESALRTTWNFPSQSNQMWILNSNTLLWPYSVLGESVFILLVN